MLPKRFTGDKNYLLREAQAILQDRLMVYLCAQLRRGYSQQFNPLGLQDRVTVKISQTQPAHQNLDGLYDTLATIYRYTHRDNQLPLLFCGKSHTEVYGLEWSAWFMQQCQHLCQQPAFIKLGLGLTFLNTQLGNNLAELRIRQYVQDIWGLKVHKRWGLRVAS